MGNKINILHLCSSLSWGGAEMSAVKLAKQFSKKGYEVVFAADPDGRIIKELQDSDIEIVRLRLFRFFDLFAVVKLIRIVREKNIKLIHCHLSRDLAHLFWVTLFAKSLSIILDKQVSSNISKKSFVHHLIYSKVSKIFVLSSYLGKNVLETCPVSDANVVVIPGGIKLEDYDVPVSIREKIKKEWKISEQDFVFGSVCRIDRQKGLEELVRAFGMLVKEQSNVKLVLVGEPTVGEQEFSVKLLQLVEDLKLANKIIFAGYRSDVSHVLSAFDVFVLPSYGESFGYVFIEALASRLPVIATNAGGVPDIVVDNVCGILVPPRDQNKLYEAMFRLLSDKLLRMQLSYAGYQRVKEKFLESERLKKIENEYQSLINSRNN